MKRPISRPTYFAFVGPLTSMLLMRGDGASLFINGSSIVSKSMVQHLFFSDTAFSSIV